MSDTVPNHVEKAEENVTPQCQKPFGDAAKENVTVVADDAAGAVEPKVQKSPAEKLVDASASKVECQTFISEALVDSPSELESQNPASEKVVDAGASKVEDQKPSSEKLVDTAASKVEDEKPIWMSLLDGSSELESQKPASEKLVETGASKVEDQKLPSEKPIDSKQSKVDDAQVEDAFNLDSVKKTASNIADTLSTAIVNSTDCIDSKTEDVTKP